MNLQTIIAESVQNNPVTAHPCVCLFYKCRLRYYLAEREFAGKSVFFHTLIKPYFCNNRTFAKYNDWDNVQYIKVLQPII